MGGKRRLRLLSLILILFLIDPGNLRAFEADLHYMWTYYLALHMGYSKRQAFQLASATFAIDADKDTGPMEAGGKDVIFGANHPAVFGLIHPGLCETRNPRIAEIWKNFHAFQPEEIIKDRSFGNELKFIEDPETWREVEMFLLSLMKEQIDNQFRRGRAEELFQLALSEGNPGPYLHYIQDFYSHALFTNFRGHVTAGHAPDFISCNDEVSRQATETTIFGLQRFMRESLKKAPRASLDRARIQEVLSRMIAANPLPGTIKNYIQGFEQLKYGWLWPFVLPEEQAIDLSRLGSPDLLAGWRVINQAIREDEATGCLPRVAKDCNTELPSKWVQYDFDGEGRVKNPRYRVENLNLELGKVKQEIQLIDSANFRADIHLPYNISGFADIRDADGTEFMGPLAVTESVQLSDFAEPRERHEARKPSKNSADGRSFEDEYTIDMPVERGFSVFEQGPLTYTIRVDVCGLDSKSFTGQITLDEACAEPIETVKRLSPQLTIRTDRVQKAAKNLKELLANVSSIESEAGDLVKKAEELQNASTQLINKCAAQSAAQGDDLRVSQYQITEASKSLIGVRDTADKLAATTCALAERAEAQTDSTKVARLVEGAEEFARQTRKQATEASGLLEIGQAAYESLQSVSSADQPLRNEAKQLRQQLDAYAQKLSQLQQDLNDQLAGPDSASALQATLSGAIGEYQTFFKQITALPEVCSAAAGSSDEEARTLQAALLAAQETAKSDVTSIQQKGQRASEQLSSADAAFGLLQEGSSPCSSDSQATQDIDLVDLSAALDTMELYTKLVADSAQKAEDCASRVQVLKQPSGLSGSGAAVLGAPLPPSVEEIPDDDGQPPAVEDIPDSGTADIPQPPQPSKPAIGPRWILQEVKVSPDPYEGWTYSSGSSSASLKVYSGERAEFQWTQPPAQIGSDGFNMTVNVQATPVGNGSLAAIIGLSTIGFESDNLPGEARTAYAKGENGSAASDQRTVMLRPLSTSTELEIKISFMWAINFVYKYRLSQ